MTEALLLSLRPIGWAMIHSLWQGVILLAVVVPLMFALRKKSASLRYLILYSSLLALVAVPVMTSKLQLPDAAVTTATGAGSAAFSLSQSSVEIAGVEDQGWRSNLPEQASTILEPALPWIAALWFAGFLVSLSRLAFDWIRLRRLLLRAELCTNILWITTVTQLRERLKLDRVITLLQTSAIDVPTVVGWLRPVILVPTATLTGLSPRQLETILAHEMAHIHRNDFLMNLVQSIAETLLFFHPAAWWLSKQIREERENCCDDLAVEICGDAVLHARALAELETLRSLRLSPAVAANDGSLLSRVRRLVSAPTDDSAPSLLGLGALTVVLLATIAMAPRLDGAATMPQFDIASIKEGWSELAGTRAKTSVDVVASRKETQTSDEGHNEEHDSENHLLNENHADSDGDAHQKHHDKPIDLGNLTVDELVSMKSLGINPEFLARWERLGYAHLTIDEASSIAALGINETFAKAMSEEFGHQISIEELSGLKAVGVDRDFVRSMREFAKREVSVEDVTGARAVGVTTEYARKLGEAGFAAEELEHLTGARAVGVTPQLIDALRANNVLAHSLEEVTSLRAVGVTPEFIKGIRAAGVDTEDAGEITGMRAVGVTPEYINELRAAGIRVADAESLTELRAVGVSANYIHDLKRAGITKLDVNDIAHLRALGVTGDWMERLRAAGYANLSVEELTKMRSAGIDAEWIENLKKRKRQ